MPLARDQCLGAECFAVGATLIRRRSSIQGAGVGNNTQFADKASAISDRWRVIGWLDEWRYAAHSATCIPGDPLALQSVWGALVHFLFKPAVKTHWILTRRSGILLAGAGEPRAKA
jgi:hypothetical protein